MSNNSKSWTDEDRALLKYLERSYTTAAAQAYIKDYGDDALALARYVRRLDTVKYSVGVCSDTVFGCAIAHVEAPAPDKNSYAMASALRAVFASAASGVRTSVLGTASWIRDDV